MTILRLITDCRVLRDGTRPNAPISSARASRAPAMNPAQSQPFTHKKKQAGGHFSLSLFFSHYEEDKERGQDIRYALHNEEEEEEKINKGVTTIKVPPPRRPSARNPPVRLDPCGDPPLLCKGGPGNLGALERKQMDNSFQSLPGQ